MDAIVPHAFHPLEIFEASNFFNESISEVLSLKGGWLKLKRKPIKLEANSFFIGQDFYGAKVKKMQNT